MKSISINPFVAALFVTIALPLAARQDPPKLPDPGPGPTMAETKAWLESDGVAFMSGATELIQFPGSSILTVMTKEEQNLKLENCSLTWVGHITTKTTVPGKPDEIDNSVTTYEMPMKDVDVAGVQVVPRGPANDPSGFNVNVPIRAALGPTITYKSSRDNEPKKQAGAGFEVRTEADGGRIAAAIKRAAILCGAPKGSF